MAALAKSCDANRPTFPWREPRRVSGVLARTYFASPARPQDVLNASPRHRRPNKFLDFLARPKRFELLTPRFVVWCSIQLSYGRVNDFSRLAHSRWCRRRCSGSLTPRPPRQPGGRFFRFGRDHIGGENPQGKRRSRLGPRRCFAFSGRQNTSTASGSRALRASDSCLQL
jgi:hypothetical protein